LGDKLKTSEEKQFGESEQHSQTLSSLKANLNKEKEQLKEQLELEWKEKEKL
jgi:hypothetical protein